MTNVIDEWIAEAEYRDMLDEEYPMVSIEGNEWYASSVFEALNPRDFRRSFLRWARSQGYELV